MLDFVSSTAFKDRFILHIENKQSIVFVFYKIHGIQKGIENKMKGKNKTPEINLKK